MATPPPVYVLGGAQTDFARNWTKEGKHFIGPMREAIRRRDGSHSASSPREIQTAHVGNFAAELYAQAGPSGAFFVDIDPAFSGLPTSRHEAACASGSIAILAASAEIEAGRYDLAAVVGIEQMKTVDSAIGGDFLGTAAWYEREAKGIEFPFPKLFGRLGDEYDKRFGLKDEHLAHIAAVNYSNARRNPLAQTRNWYMSESHAQKYQQVQHRDRRTDQGERLLPGHRRRRRDFSGLRRSTPPNMPSAATSSSTRFRESSDGAIIRRRSNSTPKSPRATTILTCCRIRVRRSSTRSSAPESPASRR